MEVILLEPVRNVGRLGQKVKVSPGFARNFLIPQGKAVPANEANVAVFEARRAELEKAAAEKLAVAQERSKKFADLVINLVRQTVGEEGKLYGAVGVQEIVEALKERGIEVEKREVNLVEGPIRTIGEFSASIELHSEVVAHVTIKVDAQ